MVNAAADGLLVVIVLYNCPPEKSPAVQEICRAAQLYSGPLSLLLYDNSPRSAATLKPVPNLNVVYQHDKHNSGVGRAYNQGAELAVKNGLKWMLLLDQDTHPVQNYLAIFHQHREENHWCRLFAPVLQDKEITVSPFVWKWGRGRPLRKIPAPGSYDFKNRALANSGLFVAVNYFNRVGGYTEEIGLDFADIDFCMKAADIGEKFVLLPVSLKHNLSALFGNNADAVMIRLTRYIRSARIFAEQHGQVWPVGLRLAVKALQLAIKFRMSQFLTIYINEFFNRRGHQKDVG